MRILIVAGKLPYSSSGVYTLEVVRGLVERGHDVEVVAQGGALFPRLSEMGVEVYKQRHNFFSFRRMVNFLREFAPEIIHSTGGSAALDIAHALGRRLAVPFLHTIHSWLPENRREVFPNALAGVIVVNQGLREHLVNDLNLPKARIRVIPYGVDGARVRLREPTSESDPDRIIGIGTVGRLDEGRRHAEFLEAAAQVRERLKNVHFVVAGEGPDEPRLRSIARKPPLRDCVTFMQPTHSAEIFNVLDIVVIVSDWGGVGLSLLDAMVYERPVIVTGSSEVFALLGHADSCVLVPANDRDQLANAIVELATDPARRRQLGRNARQYVLENFPAEAHIAALEDHYSRCLSLSRV
ncbi:MAG: glycosyltransferase family 4 protein [Planctomycetota bacterium]